MERNSNCHLNYGDNVIQTLLLLALSQFGSYLSGWMIEGLSVALSELSLAELGYGALLSVCARWL